MAIRRFVNGMSAVKKTVAVGVGLILVGGAAVGVFLTTRHDVPAYDPDYAQKSAEFCVDALNEKLQSSVIDPTTGVPVPTLEGLNPGAGRTLKAISIAGDSVKMVTADRSGQNVQTNLFDAAVFFTRFLSLSKDPVLMVFGEASEPWLRCSQALAYFEQEQAKRSAADLQGWIFERGRPPAGGGTPPVVPVPGAAPEQSSGRQVADLDGTWTLSRTNLTCTNFREGCAATPVTIDLGDCGATQCTVSRSDGVWRTPHPMRVAAGGASLSTTFRDVGVICDEQRRVGSITLELTVTSPMTMTGTYTVETVTTCPSDGGPGRATYSVTGARS